MELGYRRRGKGFTRRQSSFRATVRQREVGKSLPQHRGGTKGDERARVKTGPDLAVRQNSARAERDPTMPSQCRKSI